MLGFPQLNATLGEEDNIRISRQDGARAVYAVVVLGPVHGCAGERYDRTCVSVHFDLAVVFVAGGCSGRGGDGQCCCGGLCEICADDAWTASISPDGQTLLCVGDSPDVYLHRITGGSHITFSPIATLSLSSYIQHSHDSVSGLSQVSSIPASFSTAFSADGSKFAVASQEGVVVV